MPVKRYMTPNESSGRAFNFGAPQTFSTLLTYNPGLKFLIVIVKAWKQMRHRMELHSLLDSFLPLQSETCQHLQDYGAILHPLKYPARLRCIGGGMRNLSETMDLLTAQKTARTVICCFWEAFLNLGEGPNARALRHKQTFTVTQK